MPDSDNEYGNSSENQLVELKVEFSNMDISTELISKANDKSVSETDALRINLAIFDLNGNLVKDTIQNKDTDSENFGKTINLQLPVGSYKFVAVAHNVENTTDAAATINSTTAVSFGTQSKFNPTYTKVQDVTIAGNTTQSVTIDFGTRRNALFSVYITDTTPSNVQKLQLIVNPTGADYTDLVVNPSTCLAASLWRYNKVFDKTSLGITSFSNVPFGVAVMLTASSQTVNVTINALDANNQVLFTRSLSNVTLQQAHQTRATGTFFSPEASSSFVFDTTMSTDVISLDD